MSVLDDVTDKLQEAEARVGEVATRLEGLADLQGTLDDSNVGLRSASEEVSKVAIGVEGTVTTLKEALTSFRDVVDVLRKSDPAKLFEGQTRLEEALKGAQQQITEIEQALPALKKQTSDVQEDLVGLQETVGSLGGQIESIVQGTVGEAERRAKSEIEVLAKSVRAGQLISATALVGVVGAVLLLLMK
jgi:chromosome segregation ATPase